jgi:hypothetical protein
MNKYPLIGGSICAVVLLVLTSFGSAIGYQTDVKKNTSLSEGSPDITIVGIVNEYNLDDGEHLDFIVQNIGDAPTQEVRFNSDTYLFGCIHRDHCEGKFFSPSFDPGETTACPITSFGDVPEPPPFIGFVRVRCYAECDNEQNYNNNFFAHSYFIMKLFIFWVFKELPY